MESIQKIKFSFISNEIRDRGIIDCQENLWLIEVKSLIFVILNQSDNNPDLIELYTKNIFKVNKGEVF